MAVSLRNNAAWQFAQTLFGTGSELTIVLILAAAKSPVEFGSVVIALSATKLIFLAFEARMHEFLTPKLAKYIGRSNRGVWMWARYSMRWELSLNVIAFLACIFGALLLTKISPSYNFTLLISTAAYNGGNTLLKFSGLAILRCLEKVRIAAYLAAVGAILKLGTLAVAITAHFSLQLLFWLLAIPAVITSAWQITLAIAELRRKSGPIDWSHPRSLRPLNRSRQRAILLSNYATGMVEMLHREVDIQIAALLAGPAEAGKYRLAKMLAMTMLEALNPIILVLLPDFARRLTADNVQTIRNFIRRITRLLGGIGAVTGGTVVLAAEAYFSWLAPQQSSVRTPVVILVVILTALAPWMWCQAFLVAAGHPELYFRSSIAGAVMAIILACVLVPGFGSIGSTIAYSTGLVVTTSLAIAGAYKIMRERASS